jgi:hypothetical protein
MDLLRSFDEQKGSADALRRSIEEIIKLLLNL